MKNPVLQLNVARAEDLPYWTSAPIQFTFESTASLSLGSYVWNDLPSVLTPDRPLLQTGLYYFRSLTLSADISELDFTANITVTPQFYAFLRSDSRAVKFREPVNMVKFFDQFDYRLFWDTPQVHDQLLCAFRGAMIQGPALIGKASITLTAVISAQEIIDKAFKEQFKAGYPKFDGENPLISKGRDNE